MNKFAVIGFGRWGKVLISEFSKSVNIDYAVNKGNKRDSVWLKKNFPTIRHTVDIDSVLRKKDIGSVIIATPISTHYALAKKSLEFDKNVFLEKPPCLTLNEGVELLKTAKKKNKVLFVNNTFSFDPAFAKLKKLIAEETVQETKFTWLKWGTFKSDIVWNLAYHDIFLTLSLYGNPQKIFVLSESTNTIELELVYKNQNVIIFINRGSKASPLKSLYVKGDFKNFKLLNSNLYQIENNKEKIIFSRKITPLANACAKFLEEINKRNKNYTDFELSIGTVKIIEKILSKH